jgi:hypothetical protein
MPHRLDRPQRCTGECVARDRREQKRDRPDDEQLLEEALERLVAILERRTGYDDDGPAVDLDRSSEKTREVNLTFHGPDVVLDHELLCPSPLDLFRRQRERPSLVAGRHENTSVPPDHLCERVLVAGEPKLLQASLVIKAPHQRRQRVAAVAESVVDLVVEGVAEPDVKERADDHQDDRHREREGQSQPDAKRDPTQAASFRSR